MFVEITFVVDFCVKAELFENLNTLLLFNETFNVYVQYKLSLLIFCVESEMWEILILLLLSETF